MKRLLPIAILPALAVYMGDYIIANPGPLHNTRPWNAHSHTPHPDVRYCPVCSRASYC